MVISLLLILIIDVNRFVCEDCGAQVIFNLMQLKNENIYTTFNNPVKNVTWFLGFSSIPPELFRVTRQFIRMQSTHISVYSCQSVFKIHLI